MLNRLLLPVAVLAVLPGCGEKLRERKAESTATPVSVSAISVTASDWQSTYEATGTVKARVTSTVSSNVMGYVREVRVQAGDRVAAGQLLISVDSRDLDTHIQGADAGRNEAQSALPEAENAVSAAKANLDLAEVTFQRMKDLFEKKSISNQEFDEASARRTVAQANYEMAVSRRKQVQARIKQAAATFASAEVMRSYAEIRAPFAGVVTEKRAEAGNLASPGTPLLTIEQEGTYRLEVPVEESQIARIRVGHPVAVTLDALGRTLDARVSEVVPAVDAESRAFTVKINLPPVPQLRSGVFGRAQFSLGKRQALAIPAGAVRERGQLQSVVVATGKVARMRLVTLGEKAGDRVEVLSGLNAGDQIIYPLADGVADGTPVEVRP